MKLLLVYLKPSTYTDLYTMPQFPYTKKYYFGMTTEFIEA